MTAIPHLPAKTKLEAALARYTSHVTANGANPTADQKRHIEAERNHLINLGQYRCSPPQPNTPQELL